MPGMAWSVTSKVDVLKLPQKILGPPAALDTQMELNDRDLPASRMCLKATREIIIER